MNAIPMPMWVDKDVTTWFAYIKRNDAFWFQNVLFSFYHQSSPLFIIHYYQSWNLPQDISQQLKIFTNKYALEFMFNSFQSNPQDTES